MTEEFPGRLAANAAREEWLVRFAQELHLGIGSDEPPGIQWLAVKMAPELYEDMLDTQEACRRAIARAHGRPKEQIAQAELDAAAALRAFDDKLFGPN